MVQVSDYPKDSDASKTTQHNTATGSKTKTSTLLFGCNIKAATTLLRECENRSDRKVETQTDHIFPEKVVQHLLTVAS